MILIYNTMKYVYGNRVADCETATRIQRHQFSPDFLPFSHDLPISFLSLTSSSDFFPFPHALPDFIGHTRSCLPNFRNRHLWPHMPSRFSAKIMLGLGFDLWSAGNQQRELTTSPMTLIVEQAKENTVFDMFLPLIC